MSDIPMMPFIGVRISWLIRARNSDLSLEASTAWSRARASSYSIALRLVRSPAILTNPTTAPPSSSSTVVVTWLQNRVPSLSTRQPSASWRPSRAASPSSSAGAPALTASAVNRKSKERPMTSAAS